MKKRKVLIVGAGPGGLAAAMLLAAQGLDVAVYEKQPQVGGRSSRLTLGEFHFDRGATFLMMPHKWQELFAMTGRRLEDHVRLVPLEPMYRLQFGDVQLNATTDRALMQRRIEALFPGEGAGYARFMRDEAEKFARIAPLLERPFNSWRDYVAGDMARALPKLHATGTVYSRLSAYFRDERLKTAFCFQSKYLGMSPWECPGTFTILSYLEHRYGLMHPVGGINRLCEAMADAVRADGGRIELGAAVRQVLVQDGRAVGLLLEDGRREEADDVIIGADFSQAASRLFAPGVLRKYGPAKLARKKFSCSTFMLYLGLDRMIDLPHHTVLFAADYRSNVDDITSRQKLSDEPSIYIHNPSPLDPTLAPAGQSALLLLVPVPNTQAPIDWEREAGPFRRRVLDRLKSYPELQKLEEAIVCERVVTPWDWRDGLDVYHGATFNLAHSLDQMLTLRPHNRFEELERCWLVGGGTHPGSGLPTILESAKITCAMLTASPSDRAGINAKGAIRR
ncbi:phytoene desaturase [Paenibacillus athensensis]|uniref:Phytoene desaturase n=1 Tax=Paenibacillus athensensis TaxID=1967502 RepID=A0A4Y8Q2U4_9BACL|nr:phytoene desaturase family protein [Paenibacillus athensensis]MCD1261030.1 phytoene desaturase [Paenibacillus athensensis]